MAEPVAEWNAPLRTLIESEHLFGTLIADQLGRIAALCRNEQDDCVHARLSSEEMSALLGKFQGHIEPPARGGAMQKILPAWLPSPAERRAHAAVNLLNVLFLLMRASRSDLVRVPRHRIDETRTLRAIEEPAAALEAQKSDTAEGLEYMADLYAAGGQPGSAVRYAAAAAEERRNAALLGQICQAARVVSVDEPPPGPRSRRPVKKRRSGVTLRGEPADRWVTVRIFKEVQALLPKSQSATEKKPQSATMWTSRFAAVVLGRPISRSMVRGWTRA